MTSAANTGALTRLLEQATPGPWRYEIEHGDEWWFGGRRDDGTPGMEAVIRYAAPHDSVAVLGGNTEREQADARLIALAPDAVRLLTDMADALASAYATCSRFGGCCDFNALLARFAALEERASQ